MPSPKKPRFGRRPGFDRFEFKVVPEDVVDEHPGREVRVFPTSFTPDPVLGLLEVANMAHYRGCLGYITFWRDDWSTVEGSAIMIGPGVALTAFHVLNDVLQHIVSGDLNLMLLAPTADGGRAWRIRHITRVGETDLAILSLALGSKMPNRRELSHLVLGAIPPPPGELVMIAGFRAAKDVVPMKEDAYFPASETSLKHGMRLLRAVGKVLPTDAPQALKVQIDALTEGGMSGGAAFKANGECFGILSTSIDHGGGAGTSIVHPIWPAVGTEFIDHYLSAGIKRTLLEIDSVIIEDRERLSVLKNVAGATTIRVKAPFEA